MRRRDLLALLADAAVAMPLAATAQQPGHVRRVGVLMPSSEDDVLFKQFATVFVQALSRLGWIENGNIRIDTRFAEDDPARLKAYAADLVSLTPAASLASTVPAIVAMKEQASKIPTV